MAAEFYIHFLDVEWFANEKNRLVSEIRKLDTFVKEEDGEYKLQGNEGRGVLGRWEYDIRLIFLTDQPLILFEVSCHPPSIERSLRYLFQWLREETIILVQDEDGEPSGW